MEEKREDRGRREEGKDRFRESREEVGTLDNHSPTRDMINDEEVSTFEGKNGWRKAKFCCELAKLANRRKAYSLSA